MYQEELEEDQLPEKTKRKSIVERLQEHGFLKYGATIPDSFFKRLLDLPEDISSTKYAFAILQLRELIKSEGFYCTSRGRNNDLYILKPEEMPAYNERKNRVDLKNLQTRQRALHLINPTDLTGNMKKKLEFEILRNADIELRMYENMKKRCRF